MAWVSEVMTFIAAYFCFYTKCQEVAHKNEVMKQKMKDRITQEITEETVH